MKNKKSFLLYLCLFYFYTPIKAQLILRGYAYDTLGNPLPFVNILTQQNDSSSIIAFTFTNEKGYFSFTTSRPQTLVVKATLLGFQAEPFIFNEKDKIPEILNFKFSPYNFVLKEAIVRANGRIIEKSDTTTFRADAFRDSTERNLEELLAKLPGVEVDRITGVISVQGKPIKKILIEGDDLTGKNYQLMSKNMTADVVDKIQIIDKFNENKLLKGIRRGDEKAINIILKEDKKKLLFGNIVTGFGNDKRTNNSLNLFGFYKKLKTVSFGNYNTIGQLSISDRMLGQDFKEIGDAQTGQSLINERSTPIFNANNTPSVSLGSQHIRFNKAALGSIHFVIRPNENISLNGAMTLSQDQNTIYSDNTFGYLLRDSVFNLSEKNEFLRKPLVFESQLAFQTDLSDKSILRYIVLYRKTDVENTTSTAANLNRINSVLKNKGHYLNNALDFTHRINEHKALTINAIFNTETTNNMFDLIQTDTRKFPTSDQPFKTLNQNNHQPLQYAAISSQLYFTKDKQRVKAGIGFVNRQEELISILKADDKILNERFKNQLELNQNNYFTNLNIRNEWQKIEFFGDISSGFYQTILMTTPSVKTSKSGFYALPTMGIRKEKERQTLFGTYSFNIKLPQIVDRNTGLILTDYRSLKRGTSIFVPSNSHTVIGNYTHGKFADEFMYYVNFVGSTTARGYRNDLFINNDFNVSENVENDLSNSTLNLSVGIEKYFSKLYARLKIRPHFAQNTYQNRLNNSDFRRTNFLSKSVDIIMRSAFLKWFNYHIGTTLTQNNVKTTTGADKTTTKNQSIGSFLDLYCRATTRFNARVENEYFYFNQTSSTTRSYYFLNVSCDYDILPTRLTISLSGRNLLNTKNFITSYISDISTNINSVRLLPRYILLETNWRF